MNEKENIALKKIGDVLKSYGYHNITSNKIKSVVDMSILSYLTPYENDDIVYDAKTDDGVYILFKHKGRNTPDAVCIFLKTETLSTDTSLTTIREVVLLADIPNVLITSIEDNTIFNRLEFSISVENSECPKDKDVWCVYCDGFVMGELNSYMITYNEAFQMCLDSYRAGEGNHYIIMGTKK